MTEVQEEQAPVLKREEYAELLLFVVNTMTSAIKMGTLDQKSYNQALDNFVRDIQVEMVKTGEGSVLPEQTLKKLKSFGRLLYTEYNRLKDGKQ